MLCLQATCEIVLAEVPQFTLQSSPTSPDFKSRVRLYCSPSLWQAGPSQTKLCPGLLFWALRRCYVFEFAFLVAILFGYY
jgi:hypothetical protein